MSWITIIWSTTAAASLTLGLVHLFVWLSQRDRRSSLAFACMTASVAAFAVFELAMMSAATPEEWARLARWTHIPIWTLIVSIVWFARTYFGAGRAWLAWSVLATRSLALIINFLSPVNLNLREITGLRHVTLLGEEVACPVGAPNPWMLIAHLGTLLLLAFLLDVTIADWRRGKRRRAAIVGGGMVFFVLAGSTQTTLVFWGALDAPIIVTVAYLGVLLAMGYELSREVLLGLKLVRDLEESEKREAVASAAAGLGSWHWNVECDEIWASERARSLMSIANGDLLDLNRFLQALHADDRARVRSYIERAIAQGGEFEVEFRVVVSDGHARWIAARGRIENHAGAAQVMRGVLMDVTRRKEAEERFHQAVEASPAAMMVLDGHERIVYASEHAERQFGYDRQELIGQPVEFLMPRRTRQQNRFNGATFQENGSAGADATQEFLALRKDGTEIPVEVELSPIQTDEGTFVLASFLDVSARRSSEKEIAKLREELSHMGRVSSLGQLVSSLSHEINQPLGAILRNAEAAELLLQQVAPDLDELRAIVMDICKDEHRAGDVISRMHNLLQRHNIELTALNVRELLEEAAALVRVDADARGVTVRVDCPIHLPPVQGDRVHLQQVLLNLLINAMDAAESDSSERRIVTMHARCDGANVVEFAVADSGPGIPEDKLKVIFEPFFTTKPRGTGVGLAISNTIIRAHGGRIWAENSPAGGAIFRFTLAVVEEGAMV